MYHGAYEMRDWQRDLLLKHRSYLLHNIRPGEELWSCLISKDVLSPDMVDEIKAERTTNDKIGKLLDLLPARGPDAYEKFSEALLECDHQHVGEFLMTQQATESFREGMKPLAHNLTDNVFEKMVSLFKRNTPMVQRFAERKFDMIMEEQHADIMKKEEQLKSCETRNTYLELQNTQLTNFFNTCLQSTDNIVQELKCDNKKAITKSFIREETKQLETLKSSMKDCAGYENVYKFFDNMQTLLRHIGDLNESKSSLEEQVQQNNNNVRNNRYLLKSAGGKGIQDKMHVIGDGLSNLHNDCSGKHFKTISNRLEVILNSFHEMEDDVLHMKDAIKRSNRQKRKFEAEVMCLLQNINEMRRLERESKEKQQHITDLNKQSTDMKKKTRNRKHLLQIQTNLNEKRLQMDQIHSSLKRQINSADVHLKKLMDLIPDLEDDDFSDSISEVPTDGTFSRVATPETPRAPSAKDLSCLRQLAVKNSFISSKSTATPGSTNDVQMSPGDVSSKSRINNEKVNTEKLDNVNSDKENSGKHKTITDNNNNAKSENAKGGIGKKVDYEADGDDDVILSSRANMETPVPDNVLEVTNKVQRELRTPLARERIGSAHKRTPRSVSPDTARDNPATETDQESSVKKSVLYNKDEMDKWIAKQLEANKHIQEKVAYKFQKPTNHLGKLASESLVTESMTTISGPRDDSKHEEPKSERNKTLRKSDGVWIQEEKTMFKDGVWMKEEDVANSRPVSRHYKTRDRVPNSPRLYMDMVNTDRHRTQVQTSSYDLGQEFQKETSHVLSSRDSHAYGSGGSQFSRKRAAGRSISREMNPVRIGGAESVNLGSNVNDGGALGHPKIRTSTSSFKEGAESPANMKRQAFQANKIEIRLPGK